ncbi:MAG: hypothetical protein PHU25_12470, partial [Deltaproteobacteria bacterium]|nr:hypothetical protein [Deltaproteobacteria bacterium]
VSHCDAGSGCYTTDGTCGDICTTSSVTTGRTCSGCVLNGDNVACSAGTSTPCDGSHVSWVLYCGTRNYTCVDHSYWVWDWWPYTGHTVYVYSWD